jgi:alkanesulfonate monooxygenase SsuD/methylene tetrahydromethanopterin reductase-like flavin-dependent oxidoreductase (luciferase family)
MRAPSFGAPVEDLYAAAIEQCAWADRHRFTAVTLAEHHATEDGYLPSPIVLGSAIAAVTDSLRIQLNLILLPLYNPIRVAEDLAVLDLISAGRLDLVVGLGYRAIEYEQLGVRKSSRPRLMEEAISVLKRAWTGDPFEHNGVTARVLPRPAQRPRPKIVMGGASPASARRAAAIADGYQPLAARLYEIYVEELDVRGRPHPAAAPTIHSGGPTFVHVAVDPEEAWARIAPHAVHETNSYGTWASGLRGAVYEPVADADELRRRRSYVVLTPAEAIEHARATGRLTLKPLMGGMSPQLGWDCLHLVAEQVVPALELAADAG